MCCALKQDTLSTGLYWFNPGRQEIVRHDRKTVDWDIKHQHKQIFDTDGIPERIYFLKKLIFKNIKRQQKFIKNYPACKDLLL